MRQVDLIQYPVFIQGGKRTPTFLPGEQAVRTRLASLGPVGDPHDATSVTARGGLV